MNAAQLAACTGATIDRAMRWLPFITAAMAEYGIDTIARQAMFLAQIGHESGGLKFTEEIWGPSAVQLTYEGRVNLGNTMQGDGYRFRGRGLVQTTGRFNYLKTGEALGLDLIGYPELLMEPAAAARSAAWYWQSHGCNAFADAGDNMGCTRRINGGLNGLDDRNARYTRARAALADTVETVEVTPSPSTQTPSPSTQTPSPSTAGFAAFLIGLLKLLFKGKKP